MSLRVLIELNDDGMERNRFRRNIETTCVYKVVVGEWIPIEIIACVRVRIVITV